jgi:hypothetical protein
MRVCTTYNHVIAFVNVRAQVLLTFTVKSTLPRQLFCVTPKQVLALVSDIH